MTLLLSQDAEPEAIIDGMDTAPGDYPGVVSITDSSYNHYCGGSLISNRVILTHRACFSNKYNDNFQDMGTVDIFRYNVTDDTGVLSVPLSKYEGAPEYYKYDQAYAIRFSRDDPDDPSNDLPVAETPNFALIILPESVGAQLTHVPKVKLNEKAGTPSIPGEELTVLGWGLESQGGDMPDVLQKATVEYVASDECNTQYVKNPIKGWEMCSTPGACMKDGGGPLFAGDVQVGVVSRGYARDCMAMPAIYARVSDEIEWIKNVACHETSELCEAGLDVCLSTLLEQQKAEVSFDIC